MLVGKTRIQVKAIVKAIEKAAAADATEGEEESKNAEPREPKYILGLNCVRHNSSLVLVGTTDGR